MASKAPLLLLFLFLLGLTSSIAGQPNQERKNITNLPLREQLTLALKDVNRLTITPPIQDWKSIEPHKTTLFELRDAKRIASLADIIVIEVEDEWSVPCMCYGTHEIMFHSGDEVKFRMNYKHFSRIRFIGENTPYQGEYDLTPKSAAAFADWFAKNGFPDFRKAIDEQKETLRNNQEKARRAAAMFPENIRSIIPEYEAGSQDWERLAAHQKQITDMMGNARNRIEILQSCWRAIGIEYKFAYNSGQEEPLATIYRLVKAASAVDKNQSLLNASDDDAPLFRGAFVALEKQQLSQDEISDPALARIFTSVWQHQSMTAHWMISGLLKNAHGQECMALRLKIARSGEASPTPYKMPTIVQEEINGLTITSFHELALWLEVLLDLSLQRVPEARNIVVEKLKNAPDGFDKLVLEIALACYDGPEKLRNEHLDIDHPDVQPALNMLIPSQRNAKKWGQPTL